MSQLVFSQPPPSRNVRDYIQFINTSVTCQNFRYILGLYTILSRYIYIRSSVCTKQDRARTGPRRGNKFVHNICLYLLLQISKIGLQTKNLSTKNRTQNTLSYKYETKQDRFGTVLPRGTQFVYNYSLKKGIKYSTKSNISFFYYNYD